MPELGQALEKTLNTVIDAAVKAERKGFPLLELLYEGKFDHNIQVNDHIEGKLEIAAVPALPVPVGVSLGASRDRQMTDNANLFVRVRYVRTDASLPEKPAEPDSPFIRSDT